jgi:hypothetical protein
MLSLRHHFYADDMVRHKCGAKDAIRMFGCICSFTLPENVI